MELSYFFSKQPKEETAFVNTKYNVRILTGNSNPALANFVCECLKMPITPCRVGTFANGEIDIKVHENIRGDDVFILQSVCASDSIDVNTALLELLLMIHTVKLSSAARVTAVIPHYAYSRQDQKTHPRVPISASAVAQLICEMGADRVCTVDLHCGQIQGFFHNVPMDNLRVHHEFVRYIKDLPGFDPQKSVVVSPDAGGVDRAVKVGNLLSASHIVTVVLRERDVQTVGEVEGYHCYIVDDMVDTGTTLIRAVKVLHAMGAARIIACITHGIFTEPSLQLMNECEWLDSVLVTDSIPQERNVSVCSKLKVITIAPLLAEAICRTHSEMSLSALFEPNRPDSFKKA
jgi:ribose-phosphate pyrophosphokinase